MKFAGAWGFWTAFLAFYDGIAALMQEEQVLAYRYSGKRYDCGSKIGYLEATLAMARKHPEVGEQFEALLQSLRS